MVQRVAGSVVRPFNNKKGDEMLAHADDEASFTKLQKEYGKHIKKMNDIHSDYNAGPPNYYYGAGFPHSPQPYESGPSAPPQHHG